MTIPRRGCSSEAKRDRIKVAALARCLVEWALPICEEVGHVARLDEVELKLKRR